jgi:hypothetical protein
MTGIGQHDQEIHFRPKVDKVAWFALLGVPNESAVSGNADRSEKVDAGWNIATRQSQFGRSGEEIIAGVPRGE